jgi:hypothetical protein
MEKLTDIRCKCGATSVYRFGSFLQCKACGALYYETNGRNDEFSIRHYPTSLSFEDMLDKAFASKLEDLPVKVLKSLQGAKASEIYVPYINMSSSPHEDVLIPMTSDRLDGEKMPVLQYADLKQHASDEKVNPAGVRTARLDTESARKTLAELRPGHISRALCYIQIRSISFRHNGKEHKYLAYGDKIHPIGSGALNQPSKFRRESSVRDIVNIILTVGLIACAAITYCASYVEAHGLFRMFIWNTGYMCIFRFLGAVALGKLALCLFWVSLENVVDLYGAIRRESLLNKAKRMIAANN